MYQRMNFMSSRINLKTKMMSINLFANRLYLSLGNVANYSSNKKYYDVVIAGGGMVGCAMACKLSKEAALRGMSILLLEGGPKRKEYDLCSKKNTLDKPYSNRVSAVSKSSVQLLQSIGAWQIIEDLERCNAVKEMRIWNSGAGRSGGVNNVLTFDNANDLAYIVENDTILGALYKQINEEQNITVNYDSRVNQCNLSDSHRDLATIKVANGESSFETSLLIGSDGYGSKVRSAISGQQYVGWEYGQRAVVATLHIQSDENDIYKGHVAWQKFAQLGPVALLPLDDKTCSLVWTTSYEEANRLAELSDNEFIDALNDNLSEEKESNESSLLLADDAAHLVSKVLNKYCQSNNENNQNKKIKSIPPIVVGVTKDSRASFPLGFGHACQYVGQRVALVGDAAHRIHPLAGQGVNLGFSDVTELSDQLNQSVLTGADIGDLNALLNYQTAAQRRNIPIMLGVDGIQKIYGSKNNLVPAAITTLIRNVGAKSRRSSDHYGHVLDSSDNQVEFFVNSSGRSDGEADDDDDYQSDFAQSYAQGNDYYGAINLDEVDHIYGSHEAHDVGVKIEPNISGFPPDQDLDSLNTETIDKTRQQENGWNDVKEGSPPCEESFEPEVVDFESDGLLWLPPEPENEEDEREAVLSDDDGDEGDRGDWGYLRPSNSFNEKDFHSKDKSSGAMKNVVEGHFRALVAQLLEVDNLPMVNEGDEEGWLDIITSLSWEAATLLKPDTSKSGGMDPGGYVKVKCIPCGRRSESMVVKGVVCKKNVAHRRMTSKIEKPRLLILGGALEYQRISNQLSSFDTLLQQEMDHLKMAVAKIDSHNPDILLVEKSVSRFAQEYLLAKDISLVLNIKRSLLERISRCTGAQIVPSIDQLTSPKLGYCDLFHVEKFVETHVSPCQVAKKMAKTLMFFDGCPKPLGCTILLKGAHEDELKKVKHVIQYGVFAAYHLALETSFLADEGASIHELPLQTPITVALPDKPSMVNRSISTIPGFTVSSAEKSPTTELRGEPHKANGDLTGNFTSSKTHFQGKLDGNDRIDPSERLLHNLDTVYCKPPETITSKDDGLVPTLESRQLSFHVEEPSVQKDQWSVLSGATEQVTDGGYTNDSAVIGNQNFNRQEQMESSKGDFHPSASDHQSILVSLSTRCVWKGSVCERAHLLRIKYYGSFDKPLGRFLRDNLFDQDQCCPSCTMPAEAHIHCYTHRQGSLTISVKKLPELLPGQREGKIWMWHRCLKCPRINGFPPATRRIVMSDAAWGLSFGKFLELSFSNHAAASRVANCGHSLHRDCLRFYGFGRMVACFRYASINIYAVTLPPAKLYFNYENQEWLQKESKEVIKKAEVLFNEVQEALSQISAKTMGAGSKGSTPNKIKLSLEELAGLLEQRKKEYKDSLQQMLNVVKDGQPTIDILLINKLRRLIIFDSYAWDECLAGAANMVRNNYLEAPKNSAPKVMGRNVSLEKLSDEKVKSIPTHVAICNDSLLQDADYETCLNQGKSFADTSGKFAIPEDVGSDRPPDCRMEFDPSEGGKDNFVESSQVVKPAHTESQFQATDLSDTLDAAWIGEQTTSENGIFRPPSRAASTNGTQIPDLRLLGSESELNFKGGPTNDEHTTQVQLPSPSFYYSLNKNYSLNSRKHIMAEDRPVYVSSYRELEWRSGARLLLPLGCNDLVLPVYDDEPTSIIAYALTSSEYKAQMSGSDKSRDRLDSGGSFSLFDSVNLLSLNSLSDLSVDMSRSLSSADEQVSQLLHSSLYLKDLHARISFTDEGPPGKVKYSVTCYYAKEFEALRMICCPSETDFIRSLGRCRKWGAQGGKSNVFFAKSLDDRFIIKQVTKTELESFIKFGPAYFKYLTESISTKSPTSLAKILGIYQVSSKHLKGGKEFKMDVLVMENLLFKRNFTRLYDLKGSTRARYNPDTSGSNTVLLDQNLVEAMPTSPIFVGSKAKRLLERAVWNDTSFLASIHVMDYSLLVGVDEERNELVLGIIDFMRQYTWDKHLETWVKTSGLLGGPKNSTPTVISPQQYKKRFRKAMTAYFLMVPDQWSPAAVVPSNSSSAEVKEEEEKDNPQAVGNKS